ncbi:hypothetical protein LCGC14_1362790 [marine sediment metagenome]|uniref:Uncharacterized protein n=1 Tax=marine sediment metagenome TaxID=412755 RepID=A0A0F9K861_9ZZZZ
MKTSLTTPELPSHALRAPQHRNLRDLALGPLIDQQPLHRVEAGR